MSRVVQGFWADPRHIKKQFIHFTGISETILKDNIQMNLSSEIDMIEKYLRKMGKSREVTKILEDFATLNDGSVPVVNKAVKIFRLHHLPIILF